MNYRCDHSSVSPTRSTLSFAVSSNMASRSSSRRGAAVVLTEEETTCSVFPGEWTILKISMQENDVVLGIFLEEKIYEARRAVKWFVHAHSLENDLTQRNRDNEQDDFFIKMPFELLEELRPSQVLMTKEVCFCVILVLPLVTMNTDCDDSMIRVGYAWDSQQRDQGILDHPP